ncbi:MULTISPECIES: hypothetical protein [Alphaproteobacteria]|uniref:hypothetical protein n=1 Tax=Alphaproteobacteria TaxID=28211 RepID=UPI00329A52D9
MSEDFDPPLTSPVPKRPNAKRDGYVTIRPELLAEMGDRMRALNRGSRSLLQERDDVPEGLKPSIIENWFTRENPGTREDHLRYFLKVLREAKPRPRQQTNVQKRNTLAGRLLLDTASDSE